MKAPSSGEGFLLLDVHAVPVRGIRRVIVVVERVSIVAEDPLAAALREPVARRGAAVAGRRVATGGPLEDEPLAIGTSSARSKRPFAKRGGLGTPIG